MQRRTHSEKRLEERLEEPPESEEPRGILELFDRDEDAPLARESDEDDRPSA